jgi:hypothetical protein
MSGLHDIMLTVSAMTLGQLARGKPIRVGIDAGTGIEVDDQLFGAGLVKAYCLESEAAQWPRIAVGNTLVMCLDSYATPSDLSDEERLHAWSCEVPAPDDCPR